MNRWIVFVYYILCLWSCRTWQEKDLYIQEIFINDKDDPYLILKNQGHSYIDEQGIDLIVHWDENQVITFDLDSIDPHFRQGGDSSIIPLPFISGNLAHHVSAQVDSKNKLIESDEDHNIYSRTILGPKLLSGKNEFRYENASTSGS